MARVDLKAERADGTLRVRSMHLEPDAPPHAKAALASELQHLADWLGLTEVGLSHRSA